MDALAPLPWHEQAWSVLQEARGSGRLTHAWLFSGDPGIGKRQFVKAWASSVLCEEALETREGGRACGRCRSCLQLQAGTHPNLKWLSPLVDPKTEKRKRDISIDQVRALSESLSLSAHYGQARVAVIEPADAMNLAATNALLKTIEEPPQGVILCLVTERPMSLLPTLRSRCQKLRMPAPDREAAAAWLTGAGMSRIPEQGSILQSPLRLLAWQEAGWLDKRSQWREGLLSVAQERSTALVEAGKVGRDREVVAMWLQLLLEVLAELIQLRVRPGGSAFAAIAARMPIEGWTALHDEAVEAQRALGQVNASPQLVLESLMIAWWRWGRPQPRTRQQVGGQR